MNANLDHLGISGLYKNTEEKNNIVFILEENVSLKSTF